MALNDDRLPAIDERRAVGHGAQNANDRHVKQQVAEFADVALLRRERQLRPPLLCPFVNAVAVAGDRSQPAFARPQLSNRPPDGVGRGVASLADGAGPVAVKPAWRGGKWGAHRAEVRDAARDDAADE